MTETPDGPPIRCERCGKAGNETAGTTRWVLPHGWAKLVLVADMVGGAQPAGHYFLTENETVCPDCMTKREREGIAAILRPRLAGMIR